VHDLSAEQPVLRDGELRERGGAELAAGRGEGPPHPLVGPPGHDLDEDRPLRDVIGLRLVHEIRKRLEHRRVELADLLLAPQIQVVGRDPVDAVVREGREHGLDVPLVLRAEMRFHQFQGVHWHPPYPTGPTGPDDPADVIAAQTRSGVSGMSRCSTPTWRSASMAALTTAGVEPMAPLSPIPLTPMGLTGVGEETLAVRIAGIWRAFGTA